MRYIQAAIEKEKVLVFSKTTCPFCARVKGTFEVLDVPHEVVELDTRGRTGVFSSIALYSCAYEYVYDCGSADGAEIQALLLELTGQRTVPNVFINGEHIGGCDAVMDLHAKSKLLPLLKD
ncbi:hypothetical protein BBJ28_00014629 [Nothophytophthora sp. Chile5]|nr:hypothetical protein BBJ28_00014629 [Nothophytophthora sp. Chile5]